MSDVEPKTKPPKPPRTPEEEAAHLLKKAGKKAEKEKKKGEKRERRRLPDRDHALGIPRMAGQHGVRYVPLAPCQ